MGTRAASFTLPMRRPRTSSTGIDTSSVKNRRLSATGNVPIRDQYGASIREPASKKRLATLPFAALHGAAVQRHGTRPGTLRLEALVVRIGKKDVARLASLSELGAGDSGRLPQPETVQY